jgi:hypothetical protein
MKKTQITLDASKLRNLITEREYKNKEGKTVKVQEIKFDLVEMDSEKHKVVYSNDTMEIIKTSFAVQQQTKEERAAKTPPNYIGEGAEIRFKNDVPSQSVSDVIDNSLPF